MPKYKFVWKDPDFEVCKPHRSKDISEEEWDKLYELGIGEYVVLNFDTDEMTATVEKGL